MRQASMHAFCLTFPYALLLAIGGTIGFLKKGSVASLAAGCGSGVVLGLLGYMHMAQLQNGDKVSTKWTLGSLGVSGALAVSMGRRYMATGARSPMMIAATSVLMSLFYIYRLAVPVPVKAVKAKAK